MVPNFVKTALINTTLKRLAHAGDGGSTLLGTLATALLAEKLDWGLLLRFFSEPDTESATELGKVIGLVILWLVSYFCGKKKFAAAPASMSEPAK
jgi:hypothetical protein